MKKKLFYTVFFLLIMICIHANAENEKSKIGYTLVWQGLSYEGTYTGSLLEGIPNGTGKFVGSTILSDGSISKILYSGKWKKGKMKGKGVLKDFYSSIIYTGKFKNNMLHGEVVEKSLNYEDTIYCIKNYNKDVPYGVAWYYDEFGIKINYEMFYKGISINEIIDKSKEIDYYNLLFDSNNYMNKALKLVVTIEEIEYNYSKARDYSGNEYILLYDRLYLEDPNSFIPFFDVEDELVIYGYYNDLYKDKNHINYLPSVNVVYAEYLDADLNYEINDSVDLYNKLLNFPYRYQNEKILIE